MNWFHFKACGKCGGDLVLDDGDWRCLQCGTYYYTGLYQRGQARELPWLCPNPGQGKAICAGLTAAPIYSPRDRPALPGIANQTAGVRADPRGMALW